MKGNFHTGRGKFFSQCEFTPYNGSRLIGTATSGLEGRMPQLQKAFCFLLFRILTFQAISVIFLTVQAHEEEYQTSGFVGEENL